MTSPNVIDHMIMMLELNKLNATGKCAVVTPPCSDLPTLVHTRENGKKYRGGKFNKPKNPEYVHPWRRVQEKL